MIIPLPGFLTACEDIKLLLPGRKILLYTFSRIKKFRAFSWILDISRHRQKVIKLNLFFSVRKVKDKQVFLRVWEIERQDISRVEMAFLLYNKKSLFDLFQSTCGNHFSFVHLVDVYWQFFSRRRWKGTYFFSRKKERIKCIIPHDFSFLLCETEMGRTVIKKIWYLNYF